MEGDIKKPRRLRVFEEITKISKTAEPITRQLEIFTDQPQKLVQEISQFWDIQNLEIRSSSLVVYFFDLRHAENARSELSQKFKVKCLNYEGVDYVALLQTSYNHPSVTKIVESCGDIIGNQIVGNYIFIKYYDTRSVIRVSQELKALEDEPPKFCENIFHDNPLLPQNESLCVSSGSAVQSPMITMSTAESSREGSEDRRRPKKRPLDEDEKSFYIINIDAVERGEDQRTTVMIRNIPNKYTQKMLLQTIDKKLAGSYDFFYLPIDFKVIFT